MRKSVYFDSALILTRSHAWENEIFRVLSSFSQELTCEITPFLAFSAHSYTISSVRKRHFHHFKLILTRSHAWEKLYFRVLSSFSQELTCEIMPFLAFSAHSYTISSVRKRHFHHFKLILTRSHAWEKLYFRVLSSFSQDLTSKRAAGASAPQALARRRR